MRIIVCNAGYRLKLEVHQYAIRSAGMHSAACSMSCLTTSRAHAVRLRNAPPAICTTGGALLSAWLVVQEWRSPVHLRHQSNQLPQMPDPGAEEAESSNSNPSNASISLPSSVPGTDIPWDMSDLDMGSGGFDVPETSGYESVDLAGDSADTPPLGLVTAVQQPSAARTGPIPQASHCKTSSTSLLSYFTSKRPMHRCPACCKMPALLISMLSSICGVRLSHACTWSAWLSA